MNVWCQLFVFLSGRVAHCIKASAFHDSFNICSWLQPFSDSPGYYWTLSKCTEAQPVGVAFLFELCRFKSWEPLLKLFRGKRNPNRQYQHAAVKDSVTMRLRVVDKCSNSSDCLLFSHESLAKIILHELLCLYKCPSKACLILFTMIWYIYIYNNERWNTAHLSNRLSSFTFPSLTMWRRRIWIKHGMWKG